MYRKVKRLLKYMDSRLFHQNLGGISRFFHTKEEKNSVTSWCSNGVTVRYDSSIGKQMEIIDIKKVFCFNRLDLCVRYLLFKELILQGEPGINKGLFCTMVDLLGEQQPKIQLQEAVSFYEKIKQDGVQSENSPLYNKNFTWYDDVRRLACFMALQTAGKYPQLDNMDFEWFCNHGFTVEDKIRILRAYADIHQNCGLFIFWGTVAEQWDLLESIIQTKLQVIGSFDLDFTNGDTRVFENLIYDIYNDYNSDVKMDLIVNVLLSCDLAIRVVLVSDKLYKTIDIYENIHNLKIELIERIKSKYHFDFHTAICSTDSLNEFKNLSEIVLSVNNLRNLNIRTNSQPRLKMLEMLNTYKNYMHEHNIDVNDTCIVGSAPLEIIGIRNSMDIDIAIAPELREVYGDGVTHLTDYLDIAIRNYVRDSKKCLIKDEQLIYDDNYYFVFMGCKFVNIEYILYKKLSCDREKDIQDVKLIRRFLKRSGYCEGNICKICILNNK